MPVVGMFSILVKTLSPDDAVGLLRQLLQFTLLNVVYLREEAIQLRV
jgi:hypothetical protein